MRLGELIAIVGFKGMEDFIIKVVFPSIKARIVLLCTIISSPLLTKGFLTVIGLIDTFPVLFIYVIY